MNTQPHLLKRGIPLLLVMGTLLLAGCTKFQQGDVQAWSSRTFSKSGISLSIPEYINAQEDARGYITLVHAIPYQHSDPCDWRGDPTILNDLVDFRLTIQIVDRAVTNTILATFPNTVSPNVDQRHIRAEPGFIDTVEFGDRHGYRVEVSCERCGSYHYFLPSGSKHTLHIERKIITELRSNTEYERFARSPGVILPEAEQMLFEQIVLSIKVQK